jgi:hypothetical protein
VLGRVDIELPRGGGTGRARRRGQGWQVEQLFA